MLTTVSLSDAITSQINQDLVSMRLTGNTY